MELDLQRFYNINRRALMWVAFFAILFLLGDFFAVMFLTFIFGFVMRNIARFVNTNTRMPYWAAVVGPYVVIVSLLIIIMITAIPRIADEGAAFSKSVPSLLRTLAVEVKNAAERYGIEQTVAKYVNDSSLVVVTENDNTSHGGPIDVRHTESDPESGKLLRVEQPPATIDIDAMTDKIQDMVFRLLPGASGEHAREPLPELLLRLVGDVVAGTGKFLLAVLLSFLIVLDFDRLKRDLTQWRKSSVGRFFHEAAASVIEFSGVIGSAFQCQLIIALLNAAITCAGLFVLGIEPLLLLTTIVFILGLIPVLGVFISSVPIILIAFNDAGLQHALLALVVIVIVHLLEAYVFNPRIYAARFHLNPVIVLIILLVAHELFGIWGMLLGIPVTYYVLNIAQMPSIPRKRRHKEPDKEQSAPA